MESIMTGGRIHMMYKWLVLRFYCLLYLRYQVNHMGCSTAGSDVGSEAVSVVVSSVLSPQPVKANPNNKALRVNVLYDNDDEIEPFLGISQ